MKFEKLDWEDRMQGDRKTRKYIRRRTMIEMFEMLLKLIILAIFTLIYIVIVNAVTIATGLNIWLLIGITVVTISVILCMAKKQ